MKNLPVCSLIITMLFVVVHATPAHAQFLKKILSTVKQTAQNNVNNKADQATNKAMDSVLKSGTGNANSRGSLGDTAATNRVLGAFAKAAQQNPNDTSAADVTMKALGILAGGGGVSAADSAAAIKSFMTAKGGSGMLYQYNTTITSKQKGTTKDTTVMYLTNSGDARSEMRLNMPGASTDKIINIGRAGRPQYTVMLYPESKTYLLNVIDTSLTNYGNDTYTVTKIGNENIQGFNCIHSKLTSSSNSRLLESSSTFDIWTSKEVPGYALIEKVMKMQNVQPKMMQALEKAGSGGFFIKMLTDSKDISMSVVLVKTENKSFPASLFEIPAGYTESKENMIYHMIPMQKK